MNILIITHIYPPAIDGGSRVISKLGEYLKKEGHKITVLTTNCTSTDDFINPKSKPIFTKPNPYIIRLPVYKHFRYPLKVLNLVFPQHTYISDLLKVFQKGPIFKIFPLLKSLFYLKKQRIDLIITGPFPTSIPIYANILKKIFNSKLLVNASFHQTDPDFFRLPLIQTLKNSNFIWSLTLYEKKYFSTKYGIGPEKIILAGNGVDKKFLIKNNNIKFPQKPNILFIGSLAKHKRVEFLIKTFKNLSYHFPDLTLTIAGQKTLYFPEIEQLLMKIPIKIRNKINFKFNFPQSELSQLIDDSTVLVLPSVQESFGLVLIESWSRGKPVIVSSIPSLKELVTNSKAGFVFKKDSLKSLQKTITEVLVDQTICQKLGENGLKYVREHYTWNQVVKKICQNIF
jgi:glycosyltransferase involved in cell wall biosynthesis